MAPLGNPASLGDLERFVRKYKRGMVNSLLEYLILDYAARGRPCGYDIISMLHERFKVLLSPGQVYPVIDQMAEQGLLRKEKHGRSVLLEASFLGYSLLSAWKQEFHTMQVELAGSLPGELKAVA